MSLASTAYNILSKMFPVLLRKAMRICTADFDVTVRLEVVYSAFFQMPDNKLEYQETMHRLFICSKKDRDSLKREVPCDTLVEFEVPVRLVTFITMCLNET